ncbi:uncharacterized protein ARMOST_16795 [Armillaria ostoyae]|uniref:Uncharacterized protein n=1 Tax=Armillaria ostoyae TaxID=47428 RepID=A0A284RX72_ARMOS|nr:uncharacterized protein ARMOST_16795 [Armillaria ostoyae]
MAISKTCMEMLQQHWQGVIDLVVLRAILISRSGLKLEWVEPRNFDTFSPKMLPVEALPGEQARPSIREDCSTAKPSDLSVPDFHVAIVYSTSVSTFSLHIDNQTPLSGAEFLFCYLGRLHWPACLDSPNAQCEHDCRLIGTSAHLQHISRSWAKIAGAEQHALSILQRRPYFHHCHQYQSVSMRSSASKMTRTSMAERNNSVTVP